MPPGHARVVILLLFGVVLAAGCATPRPAPPEPGVDVPAEWTASAPGAASETTTAPWWRSFGDPRLDELIDEALASNRDLGAAAARVEAAAAQARIAGATLLPQATAGLDGARRRQNFIGLPIPDGGRVLSSTSTTIGASLNVSWEADLWGRLRAGRASAVAGLRAAEEDFEATRLSLAGQTAKTWFALLEAGSQLALAENTLANRRSTRERIERRYRLGLRPALDLRFAAAAEAAAAANLAGRRRLLDSAARQLELLLSRYPAGALAADATGREPTALPPPVPAGLPAAIVARRPDLRAGENRLAAAGFDVEAARAALYPQLRLTTSGGRLGREIGDLLESDFSVWSLAAGLLQPLFQGGRLAAGVDLADARYRAQAEAFVQRVLAAFGEVETALEAERRLGEQVTALAEAAEQSAAAQKLAEERYVQGLADYLPVLEAQRAAFEAEGRLLEARRQLLSARVDLHLALGGDLETPSADATIGDAPTTGDAAGLAPAGTAPRATGSVTRGPFARGPVASEPHVAESSAAGPALVGKSTTSGIRRPAPRPSTQLR